MENIHNPILNRISPHREEEIPKRRVGGMEISIQMGN
jgi:hypothetical protein